MQNKPLLSICIPTYNREKYLEECLESILHQKWFDQEDIEIIISDNASIDNTKEMIFDLQKKYKNINYFCNEENIWPVNNLILSVQRTRWEYVWIFGDDDKILNFWLKVVLDTLLLKDNIWWLFVNYFTFSEKNNSVLNTSMIHTMNHWCKNKIKIDEIIILDWSLVFDYLNQTPTFLSSIIMKKDFFKKNDLDLFQDNLYPHTWICTLNTFNRKIWIITRPLIKGLVPEKGWWHKNGNTLFEAALDYIFMNYIVVKDERWFLLEKSFKQYKKNYLLNLPKNVILSKAFWFRVHKKYLQKLKEIYWNWIIYYMYIIPIMYFPFWSLLKKIIPSRYL